MAIKLSEREAFVDDDGSESDGRSVALELLLREHFALRQEILQRLQGTGDIEKIALTATAGIFAFLIGFDNTKLHFKFVELMLWWAPFFVMSFSLSKIRHHEWRITQISRYLHDIEQHIYGEKGFVRNGKVSPVEGWETRLRFRPDSRRDYAMGALEWIFWRIMPVVAFGVALTKTLVELQIISWNLQQLPPPSFFYP